MNSIQRDIIILLNKQNNYFAYFKTVTSPALFSRVPSLKIISMLYTYTPGTTGLPLNDPSQKDCGLDGNKSLAINSKLPHRS